MSTVSNDARRPRARLPKLCGADVELGNSIQGLELPGGTGRSAARALLREIPGIYSTSLREVQIRDRDDGRRDAWGGDAQGRGGGSPATRSERGWHAQDWGRKFLPSNGGCCYIDLDHLEICLPEVTSAHDHVAAWHAMLQIVRAAMAGANARLPAAQKLNVLVNNSDGEGNAYGSHLNFLVTRECWDEIFQSKLQYLLFLAAFQVSSIVYAGQGKAGSENGAPPARYQLSQRADFFEQIAGLQTTFARPIVNSRDEPLCGVNGERRPARAGCGAPAAPAAAPEADPAAGPVGMARLHVIFYDSNLCEVAALLKVGVMQIVLAMIEAGRVDLALTLESPLHALRRWSRDPDLKARAATWDGRRLTAVEHQLLLHERARRFVAQGGCAGIVPRAQEILDLWGDTLEKLKSRAWGALAGRLDWVLKRALIQQALDADPRASWDAPLVKHLDHLYAALDEEEGFFWICRDRGLIERVVTDAAIERFRRNPPADTRAWARAMLLRRAGHALEEMDWDSMRFWLSGGYCFRRRDLDMSDPLGFTEAAARGADLDELTIDEALDLLRGTPARTDPAPAPATAGREEDDGHERA